MTMQNVAIASAVVLAFVIVTFLGIKVGLIAVAFI